MGKNTIFDAISEENIVTGKRVQAKANSVRKSDNSEHVSETSSAEDNDDQTSSHLGTKQSTSSTDDALTKLSHSIFEGFRLMKDSFDNMGNTMVQKINDTISEKLDNFSNQEHDSDCDSSDGETETDANGSEGNIFKFYLQKVYILKCNFQMVNISKI